MGNRSSRYAGYLRLFTSLHVLTTKLTWNCTTSRLLVQSESLYVTMTNPQQCGTITFMRPYPLMSPLDKGYYHE